MARVKGGVVSRKRRKRVLKLAKGYYGAKHILFRTAKEQVMNSYYYAYRDRRQKKRDFRKLWIARINAAARLNGLSYSQLMHGLKLAEIEVNRKMLAELAISDNEAFTNLVNIAKEALAGKEYKPAAVKAEKKVEVKTEETPKKAAKKTTTKKAEAKEVEEKPAKKTAAKKTTTAKKTTKKEA